MNTFKDILLNRIGADFQVLAKVVLRQQNHIRRILSGNGDAALYTEIDNDERIIDSLEVKIRDEVIHTIVLYSPRATDLRMIVSYYDMTAYLERIGDLILNIARYLQQGDLQGKIFTAYKPVLAKMLETTENMTQNAIFAFTCEDLRLAKETIAADDRVDDLHHHLNRQLQTDCAGQTWSEQEMKDLLAVNSMSYNIERIGDNATNVAEAAIYLVEGKNIRHSGQPGNDEPELGSEGEVRGSFRNE